MNIKVIAVGKLKERFWTEACSEYLKRLSPYAKVRVVEVADRDPAKFGGEVPAMEREADDVLSHVSRAEHVVVLAIEGRGISSPELASSLEELALHGNSSVTFIIGGSSGLAQSVHARADEELSFGRITLPHNLARVVLLEQLYRAFRISRGEPYHK